MKKTTNVDMLNAIRNESSADYQNLVPEVNIMEGVSPRAILSTLETYPHIKNEFINTLMNKVVKTQFFSKVFDNPLKELKKGKLEYGSSVEDLFVMTADAKGFFKSSGGEGFDDPNHANLQQPDAAELLGVEPPKVKALYNTINFAHFFKTSISDAQLKNAFVSETGLSDLVNQIVGSLTSGAEIKEYEDIKMLLEAVAQQKQLKTDGKGVIIKPTNGATDVKGELPKGLSSNDPFASSSRDKYNGILQAMYKVNVDDYGQGALHDIEHVAIAVRTLAGLMKFPSTKYNMAGVKTFTNTEDLVFVTTPDVMAELDVMVLASAFNVSSADVKYKVVLVDELPKIWYKGRQIANKGEEGVGYYYKTLTDEGGAKNQVVKPIDGKSQKCFGFLMDKNFIQTLDSVNEARQFENGRTLTTNMFLHRQGVMSNCYFSNCVALFNRAGYTEVAPATQA